MQPRRLFCILMMTLPLASVSWAEKNPRVPDFDRDSLEVLPRSRTGARIDLNNDGFEDLVYISVEGTTPQLADLDLYKPDFLPQPGVPLLLVDSASESIEAADMDGDGDKDLVFAGADPSGERFALRWLVNDGKANPDFDVRVLFDIGLPIEFVIADFDQSGRPDVLTQAEGRFDLLINEGFHPAAPAPQFRRLFQTGIPRTARIIGQGDFDGDSWQDAVLWDNGQLSIAYYQPEATNPTLRVPPTPPIVTEFAMPNRPEAWSIADFNSDGRLDFMVVEEELGSFWLQNIAADPPAFELHEIPVFGFGAARACATGDVDGDGLPDGLVIYDSGQTLVLLNNNNGATWTACEAEDPDDRFGGENVFVLLEDIDGDGRMDPVTFSKFFTRYFQETSGHIAAFFFDRIFAGDDIRDINGDGKYDVADCIAIVN